MKVTPAPRGDFFIATHGAIAVFNRDRREAIRRLLAALWPLRGTEMWYAKTDAETAIAEAPTFGEVLVKVDALGAWNKAPGTAAPYYLTTIPPQPKERPTP